AIPRAILSAAWAELSTAPSRLPCVPRVLATRTGLRQVTQKLAVHGCNRPSRRTAVPVPWLGLLLLGKENRMLATSHFYTAHLRNVRRRHAVVVGGSMAGMLAARVLSDHFAGVTLLERDRFTETPAARKGLPQGRHVHVLLERGRGALERFLPGLTG